MPPWLETRQSSFAERLATEKDIDLERGAQAPTEIATIAPTQDENLVTWEGPNDINNSMNWSTIYKWLFSFMFSIMTFCVIFERNVFRSAVEATANLYGVF